MPIKINAKNLGLIGSGLMAIGVFMPLVRLPFIGSINYLANGKGNGIFILLLAITSVALIFMKKYRGLYISGCLSLAILSYTFFKLQSAISSAAQLQSELADNPFSGFFNVAMESVQLEWGWIVLVCGALITTATPLIQATDKNK